LCENRFEECVQPTTFAQNPTACSEEAVGTQVPNRVPHKEIRQNKPKAKDLFKMHILCTGLMMKSLLYKKKSKGVSTYRKASGNDGILEKTLA